MAGIESDAGSVPAGITLSVEGGSLTVKVRAGNWSPGGIAATMIAAAWGVFWLTLLGGALRDMRAGELVNPGAEISFRALMAVAGIYCAALFLWMMSGHERLVMRRGLIRLGSPWMMGLLVRRYNLSAVRSFATLDKECGARQEGCCCSISTVDYALGFYCGERVVKFFPQLPRESKDWLRDRLNKALANGDY